MSLHTNNQQLEKDVKKIILFIIEKRIKSLSTYYILRILRDTFNKRIARLVHWKFQNIIEGN